MLDSQPIAEVREELLRGTFGARHQGFPVLDENGYLVGLVTRTELHEADPALRCVGELVKRRTVVTFDDSSLRDAADTMARERIGRLPVVSRRAPYELLGIITRSDLVDAHCARLDAHTATRSRPGRAGLASPRDAA